MARKTVIIKPHLQFKYVSMMLVLTFASALVVYLTLTHTFFASQPLSGLSAYEADVLRSTFRNYFVWIVVLLMIAVGLESLFWFHRIVGPLFAIERMIRTLGTGDFSKEVQLRRGDELKDLADELGDLQEKLRGFVNGDRKICRNIEARLANLTVAIQQGAAKDVLLQQIEDLRAEVATVTTHYKV